MPAGSGGGATVWALLNSPRLRIAAPCGGPAAVGCECRAQREDCADRTWSWNLNLKRWTCGEGETMLRSPEACSESRSPLAGLWPYKPLLSPSLHFFICKMGLRKPSSQAVMRTDKDGLCSYEAQWRGSEDSREVAGRGEARECMRVAARSGWGHPWRGDCCFWCLMSCTQVALAKTMAGTPARPRKADQ